MEMERQGLDTTERVCVGGQSDVGAPLCTLSGFSESGGAEGSLTGTLPWGI